LAEPQEKQKCCQGCDYSVQSFNMTWCEQHRKYVNAFFTCEHWREKGSQRFAISKYWFEDNYGG
jgi:hypothetical protein